MNHLVICTVAATAALALTACTAPDRTTDRPASGTPAWPSVAAATTTTAPSVAPPTPADFVVGVIVTEQKCFGSAGCSYRYTINPQYVSAKPLPESTTVIFTVTGGDQEQVGNFSIDADGIATFDKDTGISGSEGAVLRATVTQVLPGR